MGAPPNNITDGIYVMGSAADPPTGPGTYFPYEFESDEGFNLSGIMALYWRVRHYAVGSVLAAGRRFTGNESELVSWDPALAASEALPAGGAFDETNTHNAHIFCGWNLAEMVAATTSTPNPNQPTTPESGNSILLMSLFTPGIATGTGYVPRVIKTSTGKYFPSMVMEYTPWIKVAASGGSLESVHAGDYTTLDSTEVYGSEAEPHLDYNESPPSPLVLMKSELSIEAGNGNYVNGEQNAEGVVRPCWRILNKSNAGIDFFNGGSGVPPSYDASGRDFIAIGVELPNPAVFEGDFFTYGGVFDATSGDVVADPFA